MMKKSNGNKKKGGSFLSRHQKKNKESNSGISPKETVTEEELLEKESISPDDILKLGCPTESMYF